MAKTIEEVAQETSIYLCVIPQIVDIPLIAKETDVPVFSPHMDFLSPGRGTGRILPEAIKESATYLDVNIKKIFCTHETRDNARASGNE